MGAHQNAINLARFSMVVATLEISGSLWKQSVKDLLANCFRLCRRNIESQTLKCSPRASPLLVLTAVSYAAKKKNYKILQFQKLLFTRGA